MRRYRLNVSNRRECLLVLKSAQPVSLVQEAHADHAPLRRALLAQVTRHLTSKQAMHSVAYILWALKHNNIVSPIWAGEPIGVYTWPWGRSAWAKTPNDQLDLGLMLESVEIPTYITFFDCIATSLNMSRAFPSNGATLNSWVSGSARRVDDRFKQHLSHMILLWTSLVGPCLRWEPPKRFSHR